MTAGHLSNGPRVCAFSRPQPPQGHEAQSPAENGPPRQVRSAGFTNAPHCLRPSPLLVLRRLQGLTSATLEFEDALSVARVPVGCERVGVRPTVTIAGPIRLGEVKGRWWCEPAPLRHRRTHREAVTPQDRRVTRGARRIERRAAIGLRRGLERCDDPSELYLVAIPNGGVPLARRLAVKLREIADVDVPLGHLDTTLYRDDLMTTGERPALRRTEMPSAVDDHVVILVDDVVKTGRTIRAAMDALMDFGRPRAVQVVGLVDRGHRELPIKLDYVGKNVPTQLGQEVRLLVDGEGASETLEVVVVEAPGGDASRGEEA